MIRTDRLWMNVRLRDGFLTDEFEAGIEEFVDFSQRHPELMDGSKIRCPCNDHKCQNKSFQELDIVRFHLAKNGFVRDIMFGINMGKQLCNQLQTKMYREVLNRILQ